MPTFPLLTPAEASRIAEGTILFLPPREIIPKDVFIDEDLQAGAFNHPVIVISRPLLSSEKINWDSEVGILIMTSFNNTPLKAHLAQKGIHIATNSLAAQKQGCLRVVTASVPYATNTLKLRRGKGMKRDCSYVGIRRAYEISLKALAKYGGKGECVGEYRLTAQAVRKVKMAMLDWRRRDRKGEGGRLVKRGVVEKEGKNKEKKGEENKAKKIVERPKTKLAKPTPKPTAKEKPGKADKKRNIPKDSESDSDNESEIQLGNLGKIRQGDTPEGNPVASRLRSAETSPKIDSIKQSTSKAPKTPSKRELKPRKTTVELKSRSKKTTPKSTVNQTTPKVLKTPSKPESTTTPKTTLDIIPQNSTSKPTVKQPITESAKTLSTPEPKPQHPKTGIDLKSKTNKPISTTPKVKKTTKTTSTKRHTTTRKVGDGYKVKKIQSKKVLQRKRSSARIAENQRRIRGLCLLEIGRV